MYFMMIFEASVFPAPLSPASIHQPVTNNGQCIYIALIFIARRYTDARYWYIAILSFCPSVCPWRSAGSGIRWKRLTGNIVIVFFSPYSSPIILFLPASNVFMKFRRGHPLGRGWIQVGYTKFQFSTNKPLGSYFVTGTQRNSTALIYNEEVNRHAIDPSPSQRATFSQFSVITYARNFIAFDYFDNMWFRSSTTIFNNVKTSYFTQLKICYCDVYVGGKVRVSEFMIFLDLQHCGSK